MEQGPLSLLCTGKELVDNERDTFRGEEHIPRTIYPRTIVRGLPRSTYRTTDRDRWCRDWWI